MFNSSHSSRTFL